MRIQAYLTAAAINLMESGTQATIDAVAHLDCVMRDATLELDGEPAGWVAVEPRDNYPRLWSRKQPWMRMDPELEGVWSVTCFLVRKGFRRQGLMYELAGATVEYGGRVGAHVLEGYPTEPAEGKTVIWDEASVGLLQVFLGQRPAALIVSGIDQTAAARRLLEGAGCPVVQIMETGADPVDKLDDWLSDPRYTGPFKDGFGNFMTVLAVGR